MAFLGFFFIRVFFFLEVAYFYLTKDKLKIDPIVIDDRVGIKSSVSGEKRQHSSPQQLEKPMGRGWVAALGLVPGTSGGCEVSPSCQGTGTAKPSGGGVSGTARSESGCFWPHRAVAWDAAAPRPLLV